jgi:hypothetical protein
MLAAVFPALLLTACTSGDVTAAPTATGTATVIDCGTFKLGQGEQPPEAAIRCFVDAVQGRRPAQLKETRPTIEGDPIHFTYRTDATGRVEIVTDSREDSYGNQTVTRQICTGPVVTLAPLSFSGCSSAASG